MSNYFSPVGTIAELIDFFSNHTGLSRRNLNNELRHKNPGIASLIFGFDCFEEKNSYLE